MLLPQTLSVANITVPSFYVFLAASLIYFFFILWYESKKDGFDNEKILDLYCIATFAGFIAWVLMSRYLGYAAIYVYDSPLLLVDSGLLVALTGYIFTVVTAFAIAQRRHWSVYRVLDNLVIGLSSALAVAGFGNFLLTGNYMNILGVFVWVLLNIFILRYKGYKIPSGITFILVNLFYATFILFSRQNGYLIVSLLLVTMSLVLFYLRLKEGNMKTNLPADLIEHLKNKLINKDNELKKQERQLKSEDPYLQAGRAEGNSESMDEAILEDSPKALLDAKRSIISSVRLQIRRALGMMKLGKYGICEVCNQPIDKARLSFYPEATKCADCASKLE